MCLLVFIWDIRHCVFCTSKCEKVILLLDTDPVLHYCIKGFLLILEICFLKIFYSRFIASTDSLLWPRSTKKFIALPKLRECPCLVLCSDSLFGQHFFLQDLFLCAAAELLGMILTAGVLYAQTVPLWYSGSEL